MRISDWSSDVRSSDLQAALGELVHQHAGHAGGGGGDDDAVEGRLLAPALPAVAVARGAVVQAELREARLGSLQQLLEALDDRKSDVSGKSVSVSVDLGGRRIIKTK